MNVDREIEKLRSAVDSFEQRYANAEERTAKVLAAAEANDVKRIGINCYNGWVYSGERFPFTARGSIFAKGRDDQGWPVAWRIAKQAGIGDGCGNTEQHQVSNPDALIDGIYELRNGVWARVSEGRA